MDFPGTSSPEIRGNASFTSVALGVAWRYLTNIRKNPAFLLPPLIFPIFFLVAFAGGLSAVGDVPNFDYPDYTAFQFAFVLLQSAAFGGVFTGFGIAADFEYGFSRRLFLAVPHRSALILGYALSALGRWVMTGGLLTIVALAAGMEVGGSGVDLVALYTLGLIVNATALLWACGIAMRVRSLQAGPVMQMPVFLILFLAPVYVPVPLLHGWIHTVAQVNPVTPMLEAARGLLQGELVSIGAAFGCVLALLVLAFPWAVRGLRSAERAG